MKRGIAQIEVTFDLDANGILAVSAVEKTSGKKAQIKIENKDKLSAEQVDRMVRDAEDFRDDDDKAIERVEALAALEAYVHEIKVKLKDKELRGRMEEEDVEHLQAELRAADDWIDSQQGASKEEYVEKLSEMREMTIGPTLEKYAEGAVMGAAGGDEYSTDEHDEL